MTSTLKTDNKLIPLAKRYSDAIVSVALERNETDDVFADMANVSDSLNLVPKMREFLAHPVIPFAEKKDMIDSVFKGRLKECTMNLLYVLLEKNRINLLDTIRYCYENSANEAKNILKVGVVSAIEVDEDLKQRLKERLESKLNKTVQFEFEINPEIIAGLVLKIQDKTIDGSMSSKIEGFKKILR